MSLQRLIAVGVKVTDRGEEILVGIVDGKTLFMKKDETIRSFKTRVIKQARPTSEIHFKTMFASEDFDGTGIS